MKSNSVKEDNTKTCEQAANANVLYAKIDEVEQNPY